MTSGPIPDLPAWVDLEKRINYAFSDRNWLREAMTHRSFANETGLMARSDYERLEFLGDAVLELVVTPL